MVPRWAYLGGTCGGTHFLVGGLQNVADLLHWWNDQELSVEAILAKADRIDGRQWLTNEALLAELCRMQHLMNQDFGITGLCSLDSAQRKALARAELQEVMDEDWSEETEPKRSISALFWPRCLTTTGLGRRRS